MALDIQLIIKSCKANPTASDIEQIRTNISQLNIQQYSEIFALASKHAVLPLLHHTLEMHAYDIMPSEAITELKQQNMMIVQQNMLMSAELASLDKMAKAMHVNLISFKGPALAQIAYGDITLRQYCDLDILIQRKDFRAVASKMLARGYESYYPIETFAGDRVMFEMNNDCPFYDNHRQLAVELHWDFFRKLALPTECFLPWDEQENVTIYHHTLKTLSHETHLLYHSLHGSKHVWERLGWIVDIDRFIRATPKLDWDKIITMAKDLGALKMFLLGIGLADRYFQTPLPENIRQKCERSELTPFIDYVESTLIRGGPVPENNLAKFSRIINLRDTFYHKTLMLLEFTFRPGINERHTIILPDKFFWFYWLLRPFGMGWRFLSRNIKLGVTLRKGSE